MDYTTLALPTALFGLITAALVFFRHALRPRTSLPVPRGATPILGHSAAIAADARDMHNIFMRWQEECGEVFQVRLLFSWAIVTANPADIKFVLTQRGTFVHNSLTSQALSYSLPGFLNVIPPPHHGFIRKDVRGSFSEEHLRAFHPQVVRALDELVATCGVYAKEQRPMDVYEDIARTGMAVITNAALGSKLDGAGRDEFITCSRRFLDDVAKTLGNPLAPFFPGLLQRQVRSTGAQVRAICQKLVDARLNECPKLREGRAPDLLDAIVAVKESDVVSHAGLTAVFAIGGFDTISISSSWAIFELCKNPEAREKVVREVDEVWGEKKALDYEDIDKLVYLRQVWKETLRLHPAVAHHVRRTTKNVTLPGSGVFLEKGSAVFVAPVEAQTTKKIWKDPSEFRPERFNVQRGEANRVPAGAYLPFSVGVANCIGMPIANYEGVAVLATLYRHFDISLACDPDKVKHRSETLTVPRAPNPALGGEDLSWAMPITLAWRERG